MVPIYPMDPNRAFAEQLCQKLCISQQGKEFVAAAMRAVVAHWQALPRYGI
jgi:hypothetical protein